MRWATIAVASLLVLSTRRSRAGETPASEQPIGVKLVWSVNGKGRGCIAPGDVERAVETMVARRVFVQESPDIYIRIALACDERGAFVADLAMTAADGRELGTRRLEGDASSSEPSADAIALIIAVAIDSLQAERITLHVPPPRDHAWSGRVAPTAALSLGRFPSPSIGYGLSTGVQPPGWWPVGLSLIEWSSSRVSSYGKGAEFTGWQASLTACPTVFERGWVSGSTCIGGEGAHLRARGFGIVTQREADSWVPSLIGQLVISVIPIRHFAIDASAGVGVPFVRDRFVYQAADGETLVLHRPSPVSAQVGIDLAVTIP